MDQVVDGQERGASAESHEEHFQSCARLSTASDIVESLGEPLVQSNEIVGVGLLSEFVDLAGLFVGQVEQGPRFVADTAYDHVTQHGEQVFGCVHHVVPMVDELCDDV